MKTRVGGGWVAPAAVIASNVQRNGKPIRASSSNCRMGCGLLKLENEAWRSVIIDAMVGFYLGLKRSSGNETRTTVALGSSQVVKSQFEIKKSASKRKFSYTPLMACNVT